MECPESFTGILFLIALLVPSVCLAIEIACALYWMQGLNVIFGAGIVIGIWYFYSQAIEKTRENNSPMKIAGKTVFDDRSFTGNVNIDTLYQTSEQLKAKAETRRG